MTDLPLILTLRLDAASFARLDALRRAHFPPERNVLSAHLTLFHHLPGDEAEAIAAHLAALARTTPSLGLKATGLRFLGRGVAYAFEAPELAGLRGSLAALWRERLTPQDAQGFRPHVTVQNKVAPEAARSLFARLSATFEPFEARGEGLDLWWYRGGPWEPAGSFPFALSADGKTSANTLSSNR